MMRRLLIPILIITACEPGEAKVDDSATISGLITDSETGDPIANAIIDTTPPTGRIMSGADGRYLIDQGTKIGITYEVAAIAEGFQQKVGTVKLVQGANALDLALDLLRVCAPGAKRCGREGDEAVETCSTRGNIWQPAPCAASEICDATVGEPRCAGANALTVNTMGSGSGFVSSSPSGINCEPTCTKGFADGARVTLTANPGVLSQFTGWTGDCVGNAQTCEVVLDRARTVNASFDTTGHVLTLNRTGRGRVTSAPMGINCGNECTFGFPENEPITLTAVAATGATFGGWSGGGCSGTGVTCMVTMDRDRNINAVFDTQQFALDVTRMGTGAGVITSMPEGIDCGSTCNTTFDIDTVVQLDAAPNAGSTFMGWGGDCATFGVNPCSLTMSAAHSVTATFEGISHQVTVMTTGAGTGVVTSNPSGINCGADCDEAFGDNQNVVFTATQNAGSTFGGWGGACASAMMMPTCTLTVTGPVNITASFDVAQYDATVTVNGSGSVTSNPTGINCPGDCTERWNGGQPVTLTAMPAAGFVLATWGGACASAMQNATCNVTITAMTAISATFEPFYLSRLPADASCTTLLHFDMGTPLAQFCGGGAPATVTGTYGPIASRTVALANAVSAGGANEEAWIDLARPGPVPPDATIEMTIQKVGPAFDGRARGVIYSNRDSTYPMGSGVRMYVVNDGRLGIETTDGAGGSQVLETAAGVIADGTWYHVAATIGSSAGLALFVDAAPSGSMAGAIPFAASSSTAWVGSEREGAGAAIERFNGSIDEIRVSNTRRY